MHSLFLRIFMLFWAAMALIVGASIAVTYLAASHEYEAQETQSRPAVAIRASQVLGTGGIDALRAARLSGLHAVHYTGRKPP